MVVSFADSLKALRKKMMLSQMEFAALLGVTFATVNDGKTANASRIIN